MRWTFCTNNEEKQKIFARYASNWQSPTNIDNERLFVKVTRTFGSDKKTRQIRNGWMEEGK